MGLYGFSPIGSSNATEGLSQPGFGLLKLGDSSERTACCKQASLSSAFLFLFTITGSLTKFQKKKASRAILVGLQIIHKIRAVLYVSQNSQLLLGVSRLLLLILLLLGNNSTSSISSRLALTGLPSGSGSSRP